MSKDIEIGLNGIILGFLHSQEWTQMEYWGKADCLRPITLNDVEFSKKEWDIIKERVDRYFLNQKAYAKGKIIQEFGDE